MKRKPRRNLPIWGPRLHLSRTDRKINQFFKLWFVCQKTSIWFMCSGLESRFLTFKTWNKFELESLEVFHRLFGNVIIFWYSFNRSTIVISSILFPPSSKAKKVFITCMCAWKNKIQNRQAYTVIFLIYNTIIKAFDLTKISD